MTNRRLLLSPLWLIVALVTFIAGGASSAAANTGPETRVRAFDTPVETSVAATSSETPASIGRLRPETVATAVGSCVATEAASGAADDLTRVGRWMSPEEHAAMVRTGEVQVGAGGTTYVANPADVNAFTPNRFPSNYVEFDVPTSSLRPGQPGWGQIPSPDSVWGRLAAKQGVSVQSPVPACNIVLVATRSSC